MGRLIHLSVRFKLVPANCIYLSGRSTCPVIHFFLFSCIACPPESSLVLTCAMQPHDCGWRACSLRERKGKFNCTLVALKTLSNLVTVLTLKAIQLGEEPVHNQFETGFICRPDGTIHYFMGQICTDSRGQSIHTWR